MTMQRYAVAALWALVVATPVFGQPFATFTATGPAIAWTNQDTFLRYQVVSLGTTIPAQTVTETGVYDAALAGRAFTGLATTEYVPSSSLTLGNGEIVYDAYTRTLTPQYIYTYGPLVDGVVRTRVRTNQATVGKPNVFGMRTALTSTSGGIQNVPTAGNPTGQATATLVAFSFTAAKLARYVTDIPAYLVFSAASARVELSPYPGYPIGATPATLVQPLATGHFSLVLANDLALGPRLVAAGSTLLSGTFSNAALSGGNGYGEGRLTASSLAGATLSFDDNEFMQFGGAGSRSLALALSGLSQSFTRPYFMSSLASFDAQAVGSFTTAGAPVIANIPEPGTWALLTIGFGLIGRQARRAARNRAPASAAGQAF